MSFWYVPIYDIFYDFIFNLEILVIVERALLKKFIKIVPIIVLSGIYPYVPNPYLAIPANKFVSSWYPYPKTWIFGIIFIF